MEHLGHRAYELRQMRRQAANIGPRSGNDTRNLSIPTCQNDCMEFAARQKKAQKRIEQATNFAQMKRNADHENIQKLFHHDNHDTIR